MKKIFLTLAAVVALVACNKHEIDNKLETAPKTVDITIQNGSLTKAVTAPAGEGGLVCDAADLTALFADATGTVKKTATFNGVTPVDGKYTFTDVPATVSQIAVIALRENAKPATLAEAKELWTTTEMVNAAADETIVYGEDLSPVSTKTDAGYVLSAAVTVTTSHARIEVSSISCTDMGEYATIALKKMTLENYELYEATLSTTLATTSDKAVAGEGKVWSWNVLEQNVLPIVLDMEVTGNGYTEAIPEKTLTVNSYKVNGAEIEKFEAGNVYNFAINFAASNLTGDDSATVSAEVKVTISEWIINETTVGFAN